MTDLAERLAVAERLHALRDAIAADATAMFLQRHPAWVTRYGDRAREHGEQDARFHVDFLASSTAAGSDQVFGDYVQWTAHVLRARGIAPSFLAENLADVGRAIGTRLPAESAALSRTLEYGLTAVDAPAQEPAVLTGPAAAFCRMALDGQQTAATVIAREALGRTGSLLDVYADVLERSQHEVGRLWASAQITVADEHRATAITQFVLTELFSEVPPDRIPRAHGVIAGVQGELHQLGANIIADGLESDGWEIDFLGTDVRHDDVVAAIDRSRPSLIGISVTLPANIPAVVDLVHRLRGSEAAAAATLLLGGRAIAAAPALVRELGAAEPATDVREAIRVARGVSRGTRGEER